MKVVGDPNPTPSIEASEVGFFSHDELPPLSPGHDSRIPFILERLASNNQTVFLDRVQE